MTAEPDEASRGELVLYQAADGSVELRLRLEHETLWLGQRQMAMRFGQDTDTIGLRLRNIHAEGDLDGAATTGESSVVRTEGRRHMPCQGRRRVPLKPGQLVVEEMPA